MDQFLASGELELTRSRIKKLIDEDHVLVNGIAAKASRKLRDGDEIEVHLQPVAPARAVPQEMDLEILHEDEHLIVVNKPAGLVVHPAPGHPDGTLVNGLLAHCKDLSGIGGELRPGIVHRLDKDTTGVMVVSKDDATHHGLAELFATRKRLVREYQAVVAPPPGVDTATFETLYGRHPVHRKKFSSKVQRGKHAVTHYEVDTRFGSRAALVRCRLETGRTHQIRVHFSDAGSPLLGDPVYARRPKDPDLASLASDLGRQALHAAVLEFEHPATGETLRFQTPLPADMQAVLDRLSVIASTG